MHLHNTTDKRELLVPATKRKLSFMGSCEMSFCFFVKICQCEVTILHMNQVLMNNSIHSFSCLRCDTNLRHMVHGFFHNNRRLLNHHFFTFLPHYFEFVTWTEFLIETCARRRWLLIFNYQ